MPTLLTVAIAGALLLLAYLTYARWLSRRIFNLDDRNPTPAVTESDNRDFVATARSVVFGHHFTSIAGTGPIVGPAIAVMWGWLPALAWVILGCIFIGAVHDLGSIVVSMRNRARSLGDIAGDLLGTRARLIFLCILILTGWIVLAIFGLVIAAVLRQYPMAITPVLLQIPIALFIGMLLHRKGASIVLPSIIALALMYASIALGDWGPLHDFNLFLAQQPTWIWIVALLAYAYIASVLPVWSLLQPRDYINALQLLTALALLLIGLIAAALLGGPSIPGDEMRPALTMSAPMIQWQPLGAPPLFPILFITVACGACSGFHCLVGSGTTSKQIARESDARPVGYGGMLTEGFLATLVIAACAAGLGLGLQTTVRDMAAQSAATAPDPDADFHNNWYGNNRYSGANFFIPLRDGRALSTALEIQGNAAPPYKSFAYVYDSIPHPIWISDTTWGDSNGEIPDRLYAISQFDGRPVPEAVTLVDAFDANFRIDLDEGSMLWDGSQSLLFTDQLAFNTQYASWQSAGGLSRTVGAFVQGSANFIASLGIPLSFAIALMGVFVASFAATTMDTACRLQRYVIQELAGTFLPRITNRCPKCAYDISAHLDNTTDHDAPITCPECGSSNTPSELHRPHRAASIRAAHWWNPFRHLATMHGATLFAVVTAAILAALPAPGASWSLTNAGSGGLILWPLFGATNQLLAGFAFVVIGAWLVVKRKPLWFLIPPACIMLIVPASAMTWQAFIGNTDNPSWLAQSNWLLVAIACITLALEAWLIIETALHWRTRRSSIIQEADAGIDARS